MSSTPRFPQSVEYGRPKLGALVLADPHAQDIFLPVQIQTDGDVDRLFHDLPLTADVVVDGVKENHCVDGLQRPLLPFFRDRQNLVGDAADGGI